MHLDNYTPELPANGSPGNAQPFGQNSLQTWLPGLLLLAITACCLVYGTPNRPDEDLRLLRQMASAGDAGAQLQLGIDYRDGRLGLNRDPATALGWLLRAAQNGNAYAEDTVGSMYANGIGITRNPAMARYWWNASMKAGNREARVHLAEFLVQSGKRDEAKSIIEKPSPKLRQTVLDFGAL